ncbi:hypothetical protein OG799_13030 [Micromonospora sp. NBC_00898]|uniref:hypothetical protein n=1 Tax=Micromonospora sp. NBC_00898 TaxID=2975981 RepID=UPI00386FB850|nr:hypothetical protein OG799_13030 [Micromonospora sp. NBC_00898]
MDLWDVVKLLWRRWWISLPLMLLTLAMASYVATAMKPNYKATGHVTLLPPTTTNPDGPDRPSTVSPWNVWSALDALVIYAGRADVKKEFAQAGLSEAFTVEVFPDSVTRGSSLPIIEIEVVASTRPAADATLRRLVDVLTSQLADLQAPYETRNQGAITTKVLDVGQNGELVTLSIKRAVIAVVGVGLIVTAAASILVDAIARRRTRRAEREEFKPLESAPKSPPVGRAASATVVPAGLSTRRPTSLFPALPDEAETREPITVVMRRGPFTEAGAEQRLDTATDNSPLAGSEATVAVPVTRASWSNGNGYPKKSDES